MTIRKISGRTSSLAVKATVTQGGIFKAALQNPSSIKKLSNTTESLIPKIANVTARVIDHLLYDPDGFGVRHFYDNLLLNSGTARYFIKSAADDFSLADSVLINYALGRNPADTQTTEDLIGFLLRTRRTFDDAAPALDTPSLGLRKPLVDTQSFADFFFIARVKNFDETLTGTDTFARLTRTARTFDDNVGMLDAFVFIDGSTFELRRRLSDTVTVNSVNVELLRNTGNETENFSYFIDKVLDPDMELLDQLAKLGLKTITDADITSVDRPFLYSVKPVADDQTLSDVQPVFVNLKTLRDTESVLDSLLRFDAAKLLADSTTMLDLSLIHI